LDILQQFKVVLTHLVPNFILLLSDNLSTFQDVLSGIIEAPLLLDVIIYIRVEDQHVSSFINRVKVLYLPYESQLLLCHELVLSLCFLVSLEDTNFAHWSYGLQLLLRHLLKETHRMFTRDLIMVGKRDVCHQRFPLHVSVIFNLSVLRSNKRCCLLG